jgi:lipopolysaccharide export LptBFGC system permease protein LptF
MNWDTPITIRMVAIALAIYFFGTLFKTWAFVYQVPFWPTQFLVGLVIIGFGYGLHRWRHRQTS